MIRNLKTKAALLGSATLFGSLSLAGTAQAATADAWVYNQSGAGIAEAISYGANGATKVCDTYNDGYGASVTYMRVIDSTTHRLVDNNGHGTCVATVNDESNPIYALKVCSDRPNGGDVCSEWKYTGR